MRSGRSIASSLRSGEIVLPDEKIYSKYDEAIAGLDADLENVQTVVGQQVEGDLLAPPGTAEDGRRSGAVSSVVSYYGRLSCPIFFLPSRLHISHVSRTIISKYSRRRIYAGSYTNDDVLFDASNKFGKRENMRARFDLTILLMFTQKLLLILLK